MLNVKRVYANEQKNKRTTRLFVWHMLKHVSFPSINLVNNDLSFQSITEDLGTDDGPDEPIDTTGKNNGNANDAVQPVGEGLVYALTTGGWDEWRDDKIDVAQ